MKFEGQFLGLERKNFVTTDGQTVEYMKLYAWVPGTMQFKALKVARSQFEAVEEANLSFGDKFQAEVEEGVSDKGVAFLRVINW